MKIANNTLKITHDCFECIYCNKAKYTENRNLSVNCTFIDKGYKEQKTSNICQHYKSKIFERKNLKEFLPYSIWIEITNSCNLKCKMCGQRGDHGYLNSPDSGMLRKNLSIENWIKVIDDVKSYARWINIRGGEPLLYSHIVEFMKHVHESNIFLSLETNATYLKKYAYGVAKYVDLLSISVDGPREIHDYVRGVEGTYDKVKEGILEYRKACNELKMDKTRPISFNCTIGVDNYKYIKGMIDVSKEMDVKSINLSLSYYLDEDVGKDYENTMKKKFAAKAVAWSGFYKESEIRKNMNFNLLIKDLNYLLNYKDGTTFKITPYINDESIINWYKDSKTLLFYDRCYVPWFLANIMPNGDVNFCCDYDDYIIGNITEHKLLDLWFNKKALKFRNHILNERFSICKRCGVNFYFPLTRIP
ncbi:MAG: radical SAM/SPASM domain-containing protein [Promethearchaeota archaeon]